jgi:hypothetical protein
MNFYQDDDELAALIQRPERPFLPWIANNNNGRVNPVQRQPEQPQLIFFNRFNRVPGGMPSNGGRKKKRTSKYSKKYKNKNHKNKNRKRQRYTIRIKKM